MKMKKLGKLTINPEKAIKNEELVNLKGGYPSYNCYCYGAQDDYWTEYAGSIEELAFYLDQMCEYGGECTPC
jgi:natural product precursor